MNGLDPLKTVALAIMGIALGWTGGAPSALAEEKNTVYQTTDAQIVCLKTTRQDKSELMGTGFFIQGDIIATVAHQIDKASKVKVFLADGRTSEAQFLVEKPDMDVALIRVPTTNNPGLPLASNTPPPLGAEVFTIGCPMELDHSLSRGVVSNPQRKLDGKTLIQTDLVVNSGNSGGPLLNQKGEVIGLIMGSMKGGSGLNFAVPISYLMTAMQEIKASPKGATAPVNSLTTEPDPNKRISAYQAQIQANPTAISAHFSLASEYFQLGQYELARQYYENVTKQDPGHLEALSNLGLSLHKLGDHPKAAEILINLIAKQPNFAVAYLNLGMVYANGLKNIAAAKQSFVKYLELDPNHGKAAEIRQWLSRNNP